MPLHDWARVEAGIFHAFHHRWISAISDVLNEGLLPPEYYALPEQFAEAGMSVRAFVRQLVVGDPLPDMPLFLKPNACVTLPLESTYLTAFAAQPARWRRVLEQEH